MSYMIRWNGVLAQGITFSNMDEAIKAAENVGADEVVKVTTVRTFPRLLTETERELVCNEIDLREYVSFHLCGDGLEFDLARKQITEMPDHDVLTTLVEDQADPYSEDEEDRNETDEVLREALKKACPNKVEEIIKEWRNSL